MIHLNTRDFEDALKFVVDATGKDAPAMLNKYALQAIIGAKGVPGAMQLTPKADQSKIRALDDKLIAGFIAKKLRAKGALRGITAAQFKALVAKEKKRRIAASGYTAVVGWSPAAKKLGGTGARGNRNTDVENSEARFGGATKATVGKLIATITNTAPMAEQIGTEALQKALDNQAADMVEYGVKKLQECFSKVMK